MSRLNPDPHAVEARRIARAAGLVVFEKPQAGGTLFRVARKLPDGRVAHLGTRGSPKALRAYVARLAQARALAQALTDAAAEFTLAAPAPRTVIPIRRAPPALYHEPEDKEESCPNLPAA